MHPYPGRARIPWFECVHLSPSVLALFLKLNIIIGWSFSIRIEKLIYDVEPLVNYCLLWKHSIREHELSAFNAGFSELILFIGFLARPSQVFHVELV